MNDSEANVICGPFGSRRFPVRFEAAFLAQQVGRPVRLQWMRDEETAWDTQRRVALERKLVLRLDHLRCPFQRTVEIPGLTERPARRGCCRAHVGEEVVGGRERRGCRRVPVGAELPSRRDRLLLPFAHDRQVVTAADDLDEPR